MSDIDRVREAALEIYTDEGVEVWMESPNRMLDMRSPRSLIESGEVGRVLAYIEFLAEGNFA
ncbi:antitoxin Xre/MbcA/ParS toxin-binding domain-containing protein [Mycobacterium dioxanotrophicus]|uniref:antitoxin Xre/MbcA/ParS toxin-binding domain-containing protein n=1 Tax=Mycobacterium dioxanotrophicus TaxID=482462 RepID=UPI0012FC0425|nr:antitoxin Xre/MbcA/ParS toxin-binding domain-containing protein [Mycobacterium dioxanotrophicus]